MDIISNLVTAQQLENYATQAYGTDRMNQDQWCYVVSKITGAACPSYDVGNPPTVLTSADDFLTGLRNFQLGANSSLQGPGGSGPAGAAAAAVSTAAPSITTANSPTPGVTTGQGLLGPTNCQFCIWLKDNLAIAALAAAVAIYFGFFYKK